MRSSNLREPPLKGLVRDVGKSGLRSDEGPLGYWTPMTRHNEHVWVTLYNLSITNHIYRRTIGDISEPAIHPGGCNFSCRGFFADDEILGSTKSRSFALFHIMNALSSFTHT